jgi:glycyl-tRNA synthetase beta chain
MSDALLIELLTEELPPKSLRELGNQFAERVHAGLGELDLLEADSRCTPYATPRRLAVLITQVRANQPQQLVERKGPAIAAALDAQGKPTKALEGFARSCGVPIEQLEQVQDGKAAYFRWRSTKPGEDLGKHLPGLIQQALKALPIPKLMRWGARDTEFVRPAHGLVMLHGSRVVPGQVLGLTSGNSTRGHRFLGEANISLTDAAQYADVLETRGAVIASFDERMKRIEELLRQAAGNASLGDYQALLNEVTALVESPAVYVGRFDAAFLAVPQECLVLSMKQHQKYFPLLDASSGKLLDRFLIVSNTPTPDPQAIIAGNERVLRARLSDAKFFFDQDRKVKLADRVERLGAVVYHNKLGTQLERVQRLRKLAGAIAGQLNAQVEQAERAAWLAKADLMSDMVGEFPELQGVMGQYYALNDGEDQIVARAIEAHYHPRYANDSLPADDIGSAVALADKLDTLVGIYGIGLTPTGDRDPFGLRRAALGVLRILAERALPLDLMQLLAQATLNFAPGVLKDNVAVDLHGFMLERLRNYLRERGFALDEIEAVVSQNPTRIDQVIPRLQAVHTFRAMPEAESLASANKRIRNILRKAAVAHGAPNPGLFEKPAEHALFVCASELMPRIAALSSEQNYAEALRLLAGVRGEVDTFFDDVMVMADDVAVRNNRLALLAQLEQLMNRVADISKLAA